MDLLTDLIALLGTTGLWHAVLENSILLLLPALGGVISERSGVTNIAMEGLMLMGAFVAVVAVLAWRDPWLATVAAIIAGGLLALVHAVVSIRFHANQIISGIAINVFAAGFTIFLANKIYGDAGVGHVDSAIALPFVSIPVLDQIPFFGPVLFVQQNVIVYLGLFLLLATNVVLFRTRLGLRIRAVGEHPQAADTAGINVQRLRYGAVVTSGFLSALSGAFLSLSIVGTFNQDMTAGRGYIALAAMIFGKWKPTGAFIACLIFGLGRAIAASNSTLPVSSNLLDMVPYVLVLFVLAGLVGRSTPPAADGIPYEPGVE
jgi:ABC-type uncharacterized transport system permease subunit